MTVARILNSKGRDVVTAQPHRTLAEAAEMLARMKIGAVIISDSNGGVLGIFSERDVVRAIAARGAEALSDPLSRHMTSKVTTTTLATSIGETMDAMTEGRFRHLPVVEDGRLVGVISIGDVVKHRLDAVEHERKALQDYIATA